MYGCLLSLILASANPSGQLAFVSGTTPEDQCVCVVDIATGAVTRVGPGNRDGAPVWSPDGAWLAFPSAQPDGIGIRLVRPDGTESRALVHTHKWNQYPRWSPEGARLAYTADDGDGFHTRLMVYDMGADAESQWGGDKAALLRPAWLPNVKLLHALPSDLELEWGGERVTLLDLLNRLKEGTTLVAVGLTGEPGKLATDIFMVTPDTAVPFPEGVLPSRGKYVEWAVEPSPKGTALAFESNDGGDREIFVLAKNGPGDVSNNRAADWNPVWSPNGQWLAFESFRGGRRGIYRVLPETARVSPVAVSSDADNWWPSWSPDGKWIAFVTTRTGDPEIFVTDMNGATIRQITNHPGIDYAPAWRPRKK